MIESVHGAFAQRQQALEPKYPHRIFYKNIIYYFSVFCVNLWQLFYFFFFKHNSHTFSQKSRFFFTEPKLDLWGLTQTTNEVLWSPWAGNVNRLSEILPPCHHRHDLSTVCQSRLPPRLLPLSLTSLQRWRWWRRRRWWGVRQKTPPQERMQEGRTGSLLEVAWEGFSHMLRLSGGLTSRYRSSVTSLKVQHHCE